MITEQEAEEICEELGFTLSEVRESGQRVNEYVATLWLEQEIETTVTLPNGDRLHRHQLVIDPDGREYSVLDLSGQVVELQEVAYPTPREHEYGYTDVGFLGREVLTLGEVMAQYEPQYSEVYDCVYEEPEVVERVPVWVY